MKNRSHQNTPSRYVIGHVSGQISTNGADNCY